MKSVLPNRPGRVLAMLGFFVVVATLGWSGEKRVWVQYQSGAKGPVMAALAQSGGRVHYEFDHLGAVAVSLPEQALNGISRNPHVRLVEEDPIRELHGQTVPYGITMVQAQQAIAAGATGTGIVVGVIDSGAYAGHPDLPSDIRLRGHPDLGAGDERTWYRDFSSHGTHVVGTIAAVDNGEGVVGVAPGIGGIYMVKVFGDSGQWIYSSTLLAAVQTAVQNGPARVINMSLGGGTQSQTEKKGFDNLYNPSSGVLLIASAGNAGNTTTSYPAGYASVMSVAAVAENKSLASFSQRNSTVEIAAPGVAVLSTTSYVANTSVAVGGDVINAVPVELAAYGTRTGDLIDGGFGGSQNSAWAGKVVLVQRGGNISFYDKVRNVQLSNGVACIIYNNLEETLNATLGAGNSSTIPAVGLSLSQGNDLKAIGLGQSTTVTSEFTQPAPGYDYYDGTSMAAPHVSGVAALIWSKYLNATNKQVRQALIESAEDLLPLGRDNSFGHGLVRANDAMTRLGQLVGGGGGGDITPPVISNVSTATSKGKPGAQGSFTVSFTTNEPATSVVSIPDLGSNGTKTTSLGTSHTVTFQGVKGATYSGTITATDAAANQSSAPFTRNN